MVGQAVSPAEVSKKRQAKPPAHLDECIQARHQLALGSFECELFAIA